MKRSITKYLAVGVAFVLVGLVGSAFAQYDEGSSLSKSKNSGAALEALAKVDSSQGDYITARYLMGLCYAKMDRNEEAKSELEKVAEMAPEHGKAQTNLARVLLNLKEDAAALNAAQRGVELTGDSGAYNVLGLAQMRLEKFDAAMEAFEKAGQLDPKNAWAFNNQGIALLRKYQDNQREIAAKAQELFSKALEIQPDNALFQKNKAFTDTLMGE